MSPVTAIVTELVAAGLGGDALIAAVARLESAGVFDPTTTTSVLAQARRRGRPGNPESAGARRTRAWRSRRDVVTRIVTSKQAEAPVAEAANPVASGDVAVTAASHLAGAVTPVTAVSQKEKSPDPYKKNSSPKPPRRSRRHNPSLGGTPVTDPSKHRVRVAGDSPLHFELLRLNPGRRVPDTGAGGWWWHPDEVAKAEASLGARVVALPRRDAVVEGMAAEGRL